MGMKRLWGKAIKNGEMIKEIQNQRKKVKTGKKLKLN